MIKFLKAVLTAAALLAATQARAQVISIPDGNDVTLGVKGSTSCASTATACTMEQLIRLLIDTAASSLPAGTNLVGKVGIDQTTQGATNGVTNGAHTYNTVAASQSAQALTGGSGGATGDYLSHCTIIPASTSPGVVTILDNSTAIYSFPGGASSLSNLVPFSIPIAAVSTSGAWKVTTGTSVSVVCVGRFT